MVHTSSSHWISFVKHKLKEKNMKNFNSNDPRVLNPQVRPSSEGVSLCDPASVKAALFVVSVLEADGGAGAGMDVRRSELGRWPPRHEGRQSISRNFYQPGKLPS